MIIGPILHFCVHEFTIGILPKFVIFSVWYLVIPPSHTFCPYRASPPAVTCANSWLDLIMAYQMGALYNLARFGFSSFKPSVKWYLSLPRATIHNIVSDVSLSGTHVYKHYIPPSRSCRRTSPIIPAIVFTLLEQLLPKGNTMNKTHVKWLKPSKFITVWPYWSGVLETPFFIRKKPTGRCKFVIHFSRISGSICW